MPTILDDLKLRLGAFSAIFRPSTLTADRVLTMPDKAGTLLVDADWAAPGAIGATTSNTGKFTTLRTGNTLQTISATAPVSPATGDLWLEVDGSNFPKYGWGWRWSGTYWLSPDFVERLTTTSDGTLPCVWFYCDPSFNYFFRSLNVVALSSITQTAANYWLTSIVRTTPTNIGTSISSLSTIGNIANTWVRTPLSVLNHINVSNTNTAVFQIVCSAVGAPGAFFASVYVVYNYARI